MTGSRRWFQYTADNSLTYAVQLDESVYETPGLGFGAIQSGPTGPLAQGRVLTASGTIPLQMRQINAFFVNSDGDTVRRRYFVGTAAAFATLRDAGVVVIDGQTYSISFAKGEIAKGVPAVDTGITDGDTDDNFAAGP